MSTQAKIQHEADSFERDLARMAEEWKKHMRGLRLRGWGGTIVLEGRIGSDGVVDKKACRVQPAWEFPLRSSE